MVSTADVAGKAETLVVFTLQALSSPNGGSNASSIWATPYSEKGWGHPDQRQ